MNELFIPCSCHSEVLRVEYDDGVFYISTYRSSGRHGFLTRLQHIWKIIRTGIPWEDDVILYKEAALKLKDYLDLYLKENNCEEEHLSSQDTCKQ